jgi:hypothetical protein
MADGVCDGCVPETPTEIAKRLWDTAIEHLEAAVAETQVPLSDAYVHIGELALNAAQFAITNPGVLLGVPEQYGLPAGAPPLPAHLQQGPAGGPRVWGSTK